MIKYGFEEYSLQETYKYLKNVNDIMRNNRVIPKFREPELERKWQKVQPILKKLKKIKIPGENE